MTILPENMLIEHDYWNNLPVSGKLSIVWTVSTGKTHRQKKNRVALFTYNGVLNAWTYMEVGGIIQLSFSSW